MGTRLQVKIVLTVACPSEADAAKSSVGYTLCNDVGKLKESEPFGIFVWRDEIFLYEAKEGDKSGDPSNEMEAGRNESGNKGVGLLWRFGWAKER